MSPNGTQSDFMLIVLFRHHYRDGC